MEVKKTTTATHYQSHFYGELKQNSATTHSHMLVLAQFLMENKYVLTEGDTIFNNTDGCSKQYQCSTALHFLSVFCSNKKVCIDRAIGAPGHGKDLVDGLNARENNI